ncbi:MAG: hypothetical protein EA420_05865 [Candidatus Competibacteraceae bacterium]|nr:MAG: hypothetical protein EA420_05865 [Candidatus Competibacteraceae bacterium]
MPIPVRAPAGAGLAPDFPRRGWTVAVDSHRSRAILKGDCDPDRATGPATSSDRFLVMVDFQVTGP